VLVRETLQGGNETQLGDWLRYMEVNLSLEILGALCELNLHFVF
jgi:hypothetical protein